MIRRDSFASRLARIGAACLWLSSCTYNVAFRPDFYTPTAGNKVPLKVAVSEDPALHEKVWVRYNPEGPFKYSPDPGYPNAVRAELGATFKIVEDKGDADLIASFGKEFPDKVDIAFTDASGKPIAAFARAIDFPPTSSPVIYIACPILLPFCLMAAATKASRAEAFGGEAEQAISKELQEIGAAIRSDRAILDEAYRVTIGDASARVEAIEKEGEDAEESGKPGAALEKYMASLRQALPLKGTGLEARLRGKIIALALSMKPAPSLPEEARSHTRRGQTFVMKAQGAEDFRDGVKEFEQAVLIAPWYADGYVNLALAREKAKDYPGAIESLHLYLKASPNASDAEKIKAKIDDLEVAAQQAARRGP